jgi:hypothetical protein
VRAFEVEGADVQYPYTVRIADEVVEQIDGVVYTDGLACVLESKDWQVDIDSAPIAKLRNQLQRRPASTIGAVFSRTNYTDPAMTLAQFLAPQTILLWRGEDIAYALTHAQMRLGLIAKYRACVQLGITYYDLRAGGL